MAVELEIRLYPRRGNGFRNNARVSLKTPKQSVGMRLASQAQTSLPRWYLQNLRCCQALGVGDLLESLIFRQWAICRSETRVCGRVDAFRLAIIQKLWRRAVGMKLDLIYGWSSLATWIVQEFLQVLDAKI